MNIHDTLQSELKSTRQFFLNLHLVFLYIDGDPIANVGEGEFKKSLDNLETRIETSLFYYSFVCNDPMD